MTLSKFLRIADIADVTPPGLDGHQYRVNFEVGHLEGSAFRPDKANTVTVTTSGTLQAIWNQTDSQIAQSSLSSVTSLALKALAENEFDQLKEVQLNSHTAPKTPPNEPVVATGTLLPVVPSSAPYEQPRGISILSDDVAEKRDQINAIARTILGDRLFELPQERAILAIYLPTRIREEFRDRIQALAHLCTALNKTALGRYLGKAQVEDIGSITLLEEFLARLSSAEHAADISSVLKCINELRKGYPTHGDNTDKFLSAHDFFRLSYPVIEYESAWDTILGRYFRAIQGMLAALVSFRDRTSRK